MCGAGGGGRERPGLSARRRSLSRLELVSAGGVGGSEAANINDGSFSLDKSTNLLRSRHYVYHYVPPDGQRAAGDVFQGGESEPETPARAFYFCRLMMSFFFQNETVKSGWLWFV